MKRNKQKLYKTNNTSDLEYNRIIKIGIGVAVFLLIFYLITAIGMGELKFGKKAKKEEQQEETKIQYKEILAGETFTRDKKEYYVLFYSFKDNYASYYSSLASSYSKYTVYVVDLDNALNKKYVLSDDEEISKITDINSLKVKNPTLIKIKDKKAVETISGRDKVLELLESK